MGRTRFFIRMILLAAGVILFANGCATTGGDSTYRFPANATQDDDRTHYLPGTFRYAIWNYHRPELHVVSPKDTARLKAVKDVLLKEAEERATAMGIPFAAVKAKLEAPNPKGGTNLDATALGFFQIYAAVKFSVIPAENKVHDFINQAKLPEINKVRASAGEPPIPAIPTLNDVSDYSPAQRRFRGMLIITRTQNTGLFEELRASEPNFFIPGDPAPPQSHPLFFERPTYMITRDKEILAGMGNDIFYKDYPPTTEYFSQTQIPPYSNVTYTNPMEKVLGDQPYMLSGKGQDANKEKPGMHKVTNRRHRGGDLSIAAGQRDVRAVVRRATMNALKNHAKNGKIDVAQFIARQVPMQMVSDYFGFAPPDIYTQMIWSRNTQQAFFHDALDLKAFDANAIRSGMEMQAYISKYLLPELNKQVENGRPPYDTMGMLLKGHAGIPGDNIARVIANTIGLLVGAGETTSIAISNIMYVLTLPENKAHLDKAVELAKKLKYDNRPEANAELDRVIWEALRMKPMNPWVERVATDNYKVTSACESGRCYNGQPTQSVDIVPGGKVYFSTHSAMHDTERFSDPKEFRYDRDLEKYLHVSINYHRCLGDDVALSMVPEMIKTMLANLNGLSNAGGSPSAPSGVPFHEYFVLNYTSKDQAITGRPDMLSEAQAKLFGSFGKSVADKGDIDMIQKYVEETSDHTRMVGKVQKVKNPATGQENLVVVEEPVRFDMKKFMEVEVALERVYTAMAGNSSWLNSNCVNLNVDADYVNTSKYNQHQKAFCAKSNIEKRKEFSACYFVHRAGGQKSPVAAFNHCAYGKDLLDEGDIREMAKIFEGVGASNHYFLKHQF